MIRPGKHNDDGLPVELAWKDADHNEDGLPVLTSKKKDDFPLLYERSKPSSLPSLLSGNHQLSSEAQLKENDRQKVLDYMQGLKTPEEKELAKNNASNSQQLAYNEGQKRLMEISATDDDPLATAKKKMSESKDVQEGIKNYMAGRFVEDKIDGVDAEQILDNTNLGRWGDENLTSTTLRNKVIEYNKKANGLRELERVAAQHLSSFGEEASPIILNDLKGLAIKNYADKDSEFKRNLETIGVDVNNPMSWQQIPSAKMGVIMNDYLNDKDVNTYLQKESPNLREAFNYANKTLLTDNKDFGINVVANKVSQEIQKSGYNSAEPIFNFNTPASQKYANTIAELTLTPQELQIYNENIRDNQDKYLDKPSFFEGVASGIKDVYGGIKSTATALSQSKPENIKDQWIKEASNINANPEGFLGFVRGAGRGAGFVMGLLSGAEVLGGGAAANQAMIGGAVFGDALKEAQTKYKSPVKAFTSAGLQTIGFMYLHNIFPAAKVGELFKVVKPELNDIAVNLAKGNITQEAAKSQITKVLESAGKGFKQNVTASAQMTGLIGVNRMVDKMFGLDPQTYEKYNSQSLPSVFGHFFLDNSIVSGLAGHAESSRERKATEQSLMQAAQSPRQIERAIEEQNPPNKDDILETIKHVESVHKELIKNNVPENKQGAYLLHSEAERVNKKLAEESSDPTIKAKYTELAKKSHEIKEGILKGIPEDLIKQNQAIREVKELYNEGYLPKGSMMMLESKKTPEAEGKFDEEKVKDYLKFVAQQSNNITEGGEFNKEFDSRKASKQIPEAVREIANEMFPEYAKTAEEHDFEQFISSKPEMMVTEGVPVIDKTKPAVILPEQNKVAENIPLIKTEQNAIQEKYAVDLSKPKYGKQNTDKDLVSKREQEKSGVNRETERKYSAKETERRVRSLSSWLEAIGGNNQEAQRNIEKEMLGEQIQEGKILAGNDRGGTEVRASGSDGEKNRSETNEQGTRSSQGQQRVQQSSGQSGTADTGGTQQTSLQGKDTRTEKGGHRLNENERISVVEKVRELSNLQNKGEKAHSIRFMLEMLRESEGDNTRTNEIINLTIKTIKENASLPIRKSASPVMDETPGSSAEMGERIPQPKEPPPTQEESQSTGKEEGMRLTHADTEQIYKEAGLPERLETPTKHLAELEKEAESKRQKGYDFDKVADKVMEGDYKFEDSDQLLFARKVADLKSKQEGLDIKSPEFETLQKQIEKLSRASDVAGTETARALQARKSYVPVEETISDYITQEKESAGVETLTDKQKETVQKEYEDISNAKRKFDEYMAQKEADFAAKMAKAAFEKQKSSTPKTKKTHEDHVEYRKKVIEDIREKLKKARGETQATIVPYAKELIAIAPDVAKLMKDLVEEGVSKLEDVVVNIHGQLKDAIPGLQEKDIHDVIAGVYNEKKQPRSELARQAFELKREAKYVNKLFDLLAGEEPKSEKAKIERNKQIVELKKHIKNISEFEKDVEKQKTAKSELAAKEKSSTEKGLGKAEKEIDKAEEKSSREREAEAEKERKRLQREAETERKNFEREFEKEKWTEEKAALKLKVDEAKRIEKELSFRTPEERALATLKTKMTNQIKELEYKLKTGDFDKESAPPKPPIKLDEEGKNLKDKLVKLKQDREIRLLQQEYRNRSPYQKTTDKALEVLNVPRTVMSSMDFSAPLRQGLIASISHPRTAGLAGIEMFKQAFSQKRFDRWFYDLKQSKNYDLMQKSELYVSDPHDPKLSAKEEAFMNNLAEKIPLVGKLIKGSERAYVGYLNKLRVDLFNRFAERFMSFGKTIENSPELYKQMADYVNNSTGRGKLGFAENAAPMLNSFLFSPRLIASRINLLTKPFTPSFYTKTPKEIRVMYVKDMLKFIGLGMTVLGLAKLGGAEVEDDPRSTDFGKIRSGKTRWDIWGGFQPYIRVFTQMATGEKKNVTNGAIKELNGDQAFGETRGDVLTRFARGKLAPVPSMVWDFLAGRTVTGDKPTIGSEAESHLLPLLYSDIKGAMQDKGVSSFFTVGIPAAFGVGVQTFDNKSTNSRPQRQSQSKPHRQTRQ